MASLSAGSVLRALALALVALLGARGVALEAMWLLTHQRGLSWGGLLVPLLRVAGWLALANVGVQLWSRSPGRARAAGLGLALVVAIAVTGARWARFASDGGPFTWGYVADREVGRFPYEAGHVEAVQLGGVRTEAHVGPDGLRVCGDPVPGATVRVAMLGDSFVFGKGVDDDGTLCVATKAALGAAAPGRFEVVNLGQPGANVGSYPDTLRFAVEAHHADVVTLGLLFPDDAQVIDVNGRRAMTRSPLYRALGAALDPEVVSDALPVVLGDHTPDLAVQAILLHGLDAVAAEAHRLGVPVVVYLYGGQVLSLGVFEDRLRALAATTPELRVIGVFEPPDDVARGIPGDGHPTPDGNRWYAERVAPAILAAAEGR